MCLWGLAWVSGLVLQKLMTAWASGCLVFGWSVLLLMLLLLLLLLVRSLARL
jgi:hypothetical protein